ncbi:hypothetical protein [Thioalkalivibrio versutus]|nr:hypothetical protein [Thioalkalivibrio versutus]
MMKKVAAVMLCLAGPFTLSVQAQQGSAANFGPSIGDREFSLSGSAISDRRFDNTNLGITGDIGWYLRGHLVLGVRQSIHYADFEDDFLTNDFWSGATRGYLNLQDTDGRMRPFAGGSLGAVYGDGVNNSGFAGLDGGLKYYLLEDTYALGRIEYQWFFSGSNDAENALLDSDFSYTVGLGYNF